MQTPWEQYSDYCALIVRENKQVRKESQHEWGLKVMSSYSRLSDSTSVRTPDPKRNRLRIIPVRLFCLQFQFSKLKQERNIFFAVQTFLQSTWKSLKEVRARKSWSTTWTRLHPTSITTKSKIKKKRVRKFQEFSDACGFPWEIPGKWESPETGFGYLE